MAKNQEDQLKDSAWMYWRYAWSKRVRTKLFSPVRAVPAVLSSIIQFILKRQTHPATTGSAASTATTELLVAIAITIGVYLGLFLLESLWRFFLLTPPKILDEQTKLIGELQGRISILQDQPQVTASEQRRREQVREQWQEFTPEEKKVVQFIHDKGEVSYEMLKKAGFVEQAVGSAVVKSVKCCLILRDEEAIPPHTPFHAVRIEKTFWINPTLKNALEFVMSEQSTQASWF